MLLCEWGSGIYKELEIPPRRGCNTSLSALSRFSFGHQSTYLKLIEARVQLVVGTPNYFYRKAVLLYSILLEQ